MKEYVVNIVLVNHLELYLNKFYEEGYYVESMFKFDTNSYLVVMRYIGDNEYRRED